MGLNLRDHEQPMPGIGRDLAQVQQSVGGFRVGLLMFAFLAEVVAPSGRRPHEIRRFRVETIVRSFDRIALHSEFRRDNVAYTGSAFYALSFAAKSSADHRASKSNSVGAVRSASASRQYPIPSRK